MAAYSSHTLQSPEYGTVGPLCFFSLRSLTDLQNEAKQKETVYDEKGSNTKVRGNRKFCKRSDDVFPGE